MYLKKCEGPRAVALPNGGVLSMADLPPVDTRWVASRKAVVVRAVRHGLISREEALARYDLTGEEFDSWVQAVNLYGPKALRVTALQQYKQL
ncbi:MAG: DUF1153 domain-containing protein [Paracoccus sp. (in: a-proteobacteria)]|uniref:CtrA inhibitor SciP n=1 Tax=Paracoccus sp. TaxID=267 RepID=UPI0026E05791|nr:DUF1153 domain-containing protein [Paracoccus sp. (in: a-proteobacteria)]MDO5622383.1 DUF1153 domain-containing protein [Paracoccus sp. (in: a-proteobacteria)]